MACLIMEKGFLAFAPDDWRKALNSPWAIITARGGSLHNQVVKETK
jgi:hypothetical protein